MSRIMITSFLVLFCTFSFSQNKKYTSNDSLEILKTLNVAIQKIESDPAQSLEIAQKLLVESRKKEFVFGMTNSLNISGEASRRLGKKDFAIKCFEECIEISKKYNRPDIRISAFNNLGRIYIREASYQKAFNIYVKALELSEEIKDSTEVAGASMNISNVLFNMRYYEDAIKYLLKADSILNKTNKIAESGYVLNNIGGNLLQMKRYDEAFTYLKRAQKIAINLADTSMLGYSYMNLGLYYSYTGRNDSALLYYDQSVKYCERSSDINNLVLVLGNTGSIYLDKKEYQKAKPPLLRAFELAKQFGNIQGIRNSSEDLAEVYAAEKDYQSAYKYLREAVVAKDSVLNEEKFSEIAVLTAKFENRETEQKNISLQKENEFQKLKLHQKDLLLYIVIIAAILILLFVILFVRQNKTRLRQELLELEQQQLRARMNPHFIFNSLNSIQHYIVHNDVLSANKYLSDFASLMRQTLEINAGKLVLLKDEIEYIDKYLILEKIRFENKFDFIINYNNIDASSIEIPPMIIQPFAENAIAHGLRYLDTKKGLLSISFTKENDYIVCKVEDNGIGRKESARLKESKDSSHKPAGIELTRKRVELIGKVNNIKLSIDIKDNYENNIATGTTVIIKFPLTEK